MPSSSLTFADPGGETAEILSDPLMKSAKIHVVQHYGEVVARFTQIIAANSGCYTQPAASARTRLKLPIDANPFELTAETG